MKADATDRLKGVVIPSAAFGARNLLFREPTRKQIPRVARNDNSLKKGAGKTGASW
jgi:hypothetical protein